MQGFYPVLGWGLAPVQGEHNSSQHPYWIKIDFPDFPTPRGCESAWYTMEKRAESYGPRPEMGEKWKSSKALAAIRAFLALRFESCDLKSLRTDMAIRIAANREWRFETSKAENGKKCRNIENCPEISK